MGGRGGGQRKQNNETTTKERTKEKKNKMTNCETRGRRRNTCPYTAGVLFRPSHLMMGRRHQTHTEIKSLLLPVRPTPPLDTSPTSPPGGRACCGEGEQLETSVSREENNKRTGPRKQRLKDGRHSADETKVSSVFHSYLAPPVPAHPLVPRVIRVLVTHTESARGVFQQRVKEGRQGVKKQTHLCNISTSFRLKC